ncbi:MAG: Asp-tRNA(Asn)/Glu-tRNA(Gln) amidotransferase subunit GatB [Candidatus Liptonbacteria bacterium]|nr:Asp-tRNA(Asn)/Glu-tRNA(Gln) amidotransferase subunit GatB [Candidatus Liptonbacteria bacterium]
MDYLPTIGLEIHVELKTTTKMFCDCPNNPDEPLPNQNVCPVCLAHPGALPVPNREAIEDVIKVGLALGGKINPTTKFDRKNYFYPDLPKGYQISQYDQPLVLGGALLGVRLHRIHLEEDTARLVHQSSMINDHSPASLVDFNRAGVPLMELVTEPDLHSAEAVANFAKELQLILRYLGVSDADMEKGQLRIEPNISLSEIADERGLDADKRGKLGTKVEVKNINSFRAAFSAVEYEIKRQTEVLERGEKVVHENRGWDDDKKKTVSQRSKEEAHDYRYFPEPDIPPFETEIFSPEELKTALPELPAELRDRFQKEYGFTAAQAEVLVTEPDLAKFYEQAESELKYREQDEPHAEHRRKSQALLFNYLTSDLKGLLNETGKTVADLKVQPEHLAHLADLLAEGSVMSRQAKDMLRRMFDTGDDPEDILAAEGRAVTDESALLPVIKEVIAEQPKAVGDYKAGKEASMQFLVGMAMKKLQGKSNPEVLRGLFVAELKTD